MTTEEKCAEIIKKIVEVSNEKYKTTHDPVSVAISFGPDWGGNALTIFCGDMHSHVGDRRGSFDELVDSLYNLLINRKGLSWA